MNRHVNAPQCPLCEDKLFGVIPFMRSWFRDLKSRMNDLHLSWGWRGKEDQEVAFLSGHTHAHFPDSPHNRTNPKTGKPESYAIDLFVQTKDGRAVFPPLVYAQIADEARREDQPIIWGGTFKSLGDAGHFQFNPDAET